MSNLKQMDRYHTPATSVSTPITIEYHNWYIIRKLLLKNQGKEEIIASLVNNPEADGPLTYVCRFMPPLDVVQSLQEIFPGSIAHVDEMGRQPLHLAIKWGASTEVIKHLIKEHPSTLKKQDNMKNIPLHLACQFYLSNHHPLTTDSQSVSSLLRILHRLILVAPSTVNVEDKNGTNALEYAIDANMDAVIINTLQKISEKDWKLRQHVGREYRDRKEPENEYCDDFNEKWIHHTFKKAMAKYKSKTPKKNRNQSATVGKYERAQAC